MLHGIGGRTIAEAKERITYDEYVDWCAYRKKHGPINVNRSLEYGFAMIAMLIHNANYTNKKEMTAFMPHFTQAPVSIEEAMERWV